MDHLPTLLKIIESGIAGNATRAASYAKSLAKKLEDQGEGKSAKRIINLIEKSSVSSSEFSPVNLSQSSLPVDRDSRFALADETYHTVGETEIQLDSYIEQPVEEFVSFVSNSHVLNEAGVGIASSMLIYGPPGCGKTHLAQYIAAKLDLPLLTARCDSLMSSLLGSTAKNIRSLFDHASNRPCVLFLDEFDALAKARDDQHELGELKRVVVSLLQNIDSLPSDTVVLAATNHESLLDPAVWRRFVYRLNLHLPSFETREKIFAQYLGSAKPKNLKSITLASEGLSGALIKQACDAAKRGMILDGEKHLDEYKLLAKIAQIRFHRIMQSNDTPEEKIKQLKSADPKLFTIKLLNEIFAISTGKISTILNTAA